MHQQQVQINHDNYKQSMTLQEHVDTVPIKSLYLIIWEDSSHDNHQCKHNSKVQLKQQQKNCQMNLITGLQEVTATIIISDYNSCITTYIIFWWFFLSSYQDAICNKAKNRSKPQKKGKTTKQLLSKLHPFRSSRRGRQGVGAITF